MIVNDTPTWIACLTPPGQSALATLGIYGPRAWVALRKLFRLRSGGTMAEQPMVGRFWLGRLGDEVADEVVVAVKRIDPVPWLEVHGHGGRQAVRFLVEQLTAQGLHLCRWEEFVHRTSADALQAAATVALTQAATMRTARILLDQQQGALARAFAAILQAIQRGEPAAAQEQLAQLAKYASLGQHLTQPWRVVVAGAPNVGKSSLVNALSGYQRSIVAPTPGTTRDVVTARIALDGWLIELADTAGLRSAAEPLEEQGIDRARATIADADLCLWLLDGATPPVWPSDDLPAVQLVLNKCDLSPAWDWDCAAGAVRVSARTGVGLPDLCATIVACLAPDPPPCGAAVPFTATLAVAISEAQHRLDLGDVAETARILAACGNAEN